MDEKIIKNAYNVKKIKKKLFPVCWYAAAVQQRRYYLECPAVRLKSSVYWCVSTGQSMRCTWSSPVVLHYCCF